MSSPQSDSKAYPLVPRIPSLDLVGQIDLQGRDTLLREFVSDMLRYNVVVSPFDGNS